jgi:hypothetical protein
MTKKSQARMKRDEVKEEAKSQGIVGIYDHLNSMYTSQMRLFEQYRKLIEIITHDTVVPFLKNITRVDTLLKGFNVDIGDLLDKTRVTHSLHTGKTGFGNPDDENEYFTNLQLQQDYVVYMGVHQQNLLPVLLELQEHLSGALAKMRSVEAEAAATTQALDQQPLMQAPVEAAAAEPAVTGNPYEQPAIDTK